MSKELNYDMIIKNGTCLISDGLGTRQISTDIGIAKGRIVKIQSSIKEPAKTIIDASCLHVLPGVIDSQVHFREPGLTHKEDLESGTRAAILGGVTSVFEMPNTIPPTTTEELFSQKIKLAQQKCYSHFAFYIGASAENVTQIQQLESLPFCSGVKIFMGSSTGSLLINDDLLLEEVIKNTRRRVIVHCEDENRLQQRKSLVSHSHQVDMHPVWRDEETALIATKKLVTLAEKWNREVHVLHVSSSEEMQFLKNHKKNSSVEILPQFLTFSAPECYERLGSLVQMNPPIRDKRHLDFLWKALRDGTVDVIGTDHAPHTLMEKQKQYPLSPSGMPGVQTLMPIMLTHVHQQKLSIEKLTELVCENVRRIFKVKNKGRIQIGYDADFTLVDLKLQKTITNKEMASRCGWTPYDGFKATGWVMKTVIDGKLVMSDGQILAGPFGRGVEFE